MRLSCFPYESRQCISSIRRREAVSDDVCDGPVRDVRGVVLPATRQRVHRRDRGFVAGCWDEVLTVAVEVAGVAGLVINRGVRDIAALTTRRFPVFCPGTARAAVALFAARQSRQSPRPSRMAPK
ncbi:RraA family protein [Mesorhizobium japonicum]|uniref:RraA family protein n=1 Tax=Mesorhizobium japonicum TaxID=2066070 RepID=UPI001FCA6BCE|nr:RraA family protein [Mesorhizobium japonicum]